MPLATNGGVLTSTLVTEEAARLFYNNLVAVKYVNRT